MLSSCSRLSSKILSIMDFMADLYELAERVRELPQMLHMTISRS